ncbi:unnamed protein product [Chironomus riparius]|uniref:Uncharacterized protein n=1 Tax=Chironomus riparius TaxID=315576 RepID=A0A9N9RUJ2_9DIPT|nr:unnamed protein product [Chironomus riparius]
MNKKLIVTLSVITTYVIICGLFIKFFRESDSYGTRFCSSDKKKFSDQFLLTEIIKSNSSKLWRNGEDFDYIKYMSVHRGRPLCGGLEYVSLDRVLADPDYELNFRGMIIIDRQTYDHERYCLEKVDDDPDGWKLMICHSDVLYHRIFHATVIFLSILLFGFTIFTYAKNEELRDFKGKAVIGLMLAEILAYSTHSIRFLAQSQYNMILISASLMGLLQILLWITVLVVHEFIAFKNFKNAAKTEQKFRFYALIEILFTILFTILIISTNINHQRSISVDYFFIAIFFIGAFDLIVLIITGIMILIISRSMTLSDQSRFKNEKKWFWITVKLSLIMLITWPFQTLDWLIEFHLHGFMIQDSILLLTAITATIILLSRKKVRNLMFGQYQGINDTEA